MVQKIGCSLAVSEGEDGMNYRLQWDFGFRESQTKADWVCEEKKQEKKSWKDQKSKKKLSVTWFRR